MEGENVEKTRRVLIADDRPHSRRGLRAVLNLRPEIVIVGEAMDGEEAVRLVAALRPHVVLMDAKMPQMDGVEATRLIKERWPEIRVVVLTIHAGYQAEALAAGADAFLVKGGPREELLAAIVDQSQEE
jgi:DNA-binding NarL/FixJ family response regulator